MTFYAAIDLHSNNGVLVVTDETDRIFVRRRLPNDLEKVTTALAPYASELDSVVVESTFNWYWLVDGLMDAGHRVRLANTAAIATYSGLKHSNDADDAAWLCHLSRVGLLKEGWICPREWRGTRDLRSSPGRVRKQGCRPKAAPATRSQRTFRVRGCSPSRRRSGCER